MTVTTPPALGRGIRGMVVRRRPCRPPTGRSPSPSRVTATASSNRGSCRNGPVGSVRSIVLSCYARGMSTRDIEAHLLEVYGVAASRELVSNITDVVTDEIEIWRSRPVDEVYPIVYIDGIADQGPGQGRGHHQVRAPGHRRGRR